MNERERDQRMADRVEASVRHALELVGPGEPGVEYVWDDDTPTAA